MTLVQDSGGVGGGDGMGGGLVGVPAVPVGTVPSTSAALVHMHHHPPQGGVGAGGGGGGQSYSDPLHPHASPSPFPSAHYPYTPPVDHVAECLMPLLRQSPKYQDQLLAMLDGYFSTEQLIIGVLSTLTYLTCLIILTLSYLTYVLSY